MIDVKRRDLLKGSLAAGLSMVPLVTSAREISASSAATPAKKGMQYACLDNCLPVGGHPAPPKQLNVVLHGMLVCWFDFKNKLLNVHAPRVDAHIYVAGNFCGEGVTARTPKLVKLSGVNSGSLSAIQQGGSNDIVIDGSSLTYSQTSYSSFQLPIPDNMIGARYWSIGTGNQSPFLKGATADANSLSKITSFPLIRIFTYTKFQSSPPSVTLDSQTIKFNPNDGVARLHIFAEPPFPPDMGLTHLNAAVAQANLMSDPAMDLRINPNSTLDVVVDPGPSPDPTVQPCELLTLDEFRANCIPCSGGRSSQPRNCMTMVVVQT